MDLILKVTGSGKDFNREWELVRSGIFRSSRLAMREGRCRRASGRSWRELPFRARPCFPLLSSRARVSSPGPSQILLGAPVPSPEMLAE